MKIVLAGANGFLGKSLIKHLSQEIEWTLLSRDPDFKIARANCEVWDGKTLGPWRHALNGADVVLNLSGKSVNCRYNTKNKAAIFASRLDSTRVLHQAMAACNQPPKVWINAASATIYRHSLDKAMTEDRGEMGKGFSVEVCKAWENCFFEQSHPGVRQIAIRTAIVLGKGAGVLPYFSNLVKWGLGGKMGPGTQMFSWIHEQDFANALQFIINNENINGVVNLAAPNPLSNADFMQHLRSQLQVKTGLPTPKWMLEMGAILLGTETELILKSRWVIPQKLTDSGFQFQFGNLKPALENLFR